MAIRFFGAPGRWLAVPGVLAIPIDLTEGAVQVMALSGQETILVYKAWVTPWKLGLFAAATLITFAAIAVALRRKFRPTSDA